MPSKIMGSTADFDLCSRPASSSIATTHQDRSHPQKMVKDDNLTISQSNDQNHVKNPCPLFSLTGECLSCKDHGVVIPERFFQVAVSDGKNSSVVLKKDASSSCDQNDKKVSRNCENKPHHVVAAVFEQNQNNIMILSPLEKQEAFEELKFNVFHALHKQNPLRYFVNPKDVVKNKNCPSSSSSSSAAACKNNIHTKNYINHQGPRNIFNTVEHDHTKNDSSYSAKIKKNWKVTSSSSLLLECAVRFRAHGYRSRNSCNADDMLDMWCAEECLSKMAEPMCLFACVKNTRSCTSEEVDVDVSDCSDYRNDVDVDVDLEHSTNTTSIHDSPASSMMFCDFYDELIEINDFDSLHRILVEDDEKSRSTLAGSDNNNTTTSPRSMKYNRIENKNRRVSLEAFALVWKRPEGFDLGATVSRLLQRITNFVQENELWMRNYFRSGELFFRFFTSIHLLDDADLEEILPRILSCEYAVVNQKAMFFDVVFPVLTQLLLLSGKLNERLRVKMPAGWSKRTKNNPAVLQNFRQHQANGNGSCIKIDETISTSTSSRNNFILANLTLLDICCWLGMTSRFKFLLDCGADPTIGGEIIYNIPSDDVEVDDHRVGFNAEDNDVAQRKDNITNEMEIGHRLRASSSDNNRLGKILKFDGPLKRALLTTTSRTSSANNYRNHDLSCNITTMEHLTQNVSAGEDLIQALRTNTKKNYLAGTVFDKKKQKSNDYYIDITSDEASEEEDDDDEEY